MSSQSIHMVVTKAKFAPVAAALSTISLVFSPSRRRLFMPRV